MIRFAFTDRSSRQAAEKKRKRQERNTRLQEQAATRKTQKVIKFDQEEPEAEKEAEEAAEEKKPAPVKNSRRRLDVPDELPAEFLESDSEGSDGEGDGSGRKPRKARKLHTAEAQLARESRGPRDEVVGTTVFRVVKKEDQRLTPKAQKSSVNTKKALLARGRTPVKARKGFFV